MTFLSAAYKLYIKREPMIFQNQKVLLNIFYERLDYQILMQNEFYPLIIYRL